MEDAGRTVDSDDSDVDFEISDDELVHASFRLENWWFYSQN